jgi:hypothetical protein
MNRLTKEQILSERREADKEVTMLLQRAKSDYTLEDVRDAIYDETEQDDMTKIISMFDTGEGDVELGEILELVIDAWNHFPHKMLGGKSPREMDAA